MKRVCFVTGTRAEFGLMQSTLRAIQSHEDLQLQLIATGTHLDRTRGYTVSDIRAAGFKIDRHLPWKSDGANSSLGVAVATGRAVSGIARALDELQSDVVLVVGDRVEAFAAATAGLITRRIVAHVHGGDRALGQVDDALRHAITKLSLVHFPATRRSADRILRLGEDAWRVTLSGTPGLDDVPPSAKTREPFALVAQHPVNAADTVEMLRITQTIEALESAGVPEIIALGPNNDPGSPGIARTLERLAADGRVRYHASLPRHEYLGLLSRCAFLTGNSSSGIIEAASAGCRVIDIGPRQAGRECGANVLHVEYGAASVRAAVAKLWNRGRPTAYTGKNVYGKPGAGARIAATLARLERTRELIYKQIAY